MKKKLGIIGGMGPAATARLFARVIDFTEVVRDQDHIDTVVLNLASIPDRSAYLLKKPGAMPFAGTLKQAAHTLEEMDCAVLAMPCNTAHAAYVEVAASLSRATLLNMPREAARFVHSLGCERTGLLATDGTIFAGVFQAGFNEENIACVTPDEAHQKKVMSTIYDYVKAGKKPPEGLFEEVLDALCASGCDSFILGCTELSLLGMPAYYRGKPVVDALDVLAWRCVEACGYPARDLTQQYT